MRSAGTYISGIGHVVLIGWLISGWGFSSEPLPFEVAEVSVVSSEEFAAMVAATTPQPDAANPTAPAQPQIEDAPVPIEPETAPQVVPIPEPAVQPDADTPLPEAPEPPAPQSDVADVAPEPPKPPAVEAAPDVIESPRPQPRPAPRVAPVAVAPPAPEADVADIVRDAVVPDDSAAAEVVEPAQTPTAPEEAATEIVIEDATPSGAVTTSARPKTRPNRPAPAPPSETTSVSDDAAVAAALAAALAATAPDLPAGPPMTGSETEGFRLAIGECWVVDTGGRSANVKVTVAFSLDRSGKVASDVRQVTAEGGEQAAVDTAFRAARTAILRCGASGYDLPADKYDQWREVEITFDPSGMRLR
jgi:hypothetical protein